MFDNNLNLRNLSKWVLMGFLGRQKFKATFLTLVQIKHHVVKKKKNY